MEFGTLLEQKLKGINKMVDYFEEKLSDEQEYSLKIRIEKEDT